MPKLRYLRSKASTPVRSELAAHCMAAGINRIKLASRAGMHPAAIEAAECSAANVKLDTTRKITDAFNSLVSPESTKTAERLFPGYDAAVTDARSRR